MFVKKGFQYVTDANSGKKVRIESHKEFHERLRKTLYYGKYTDGTLPSPTVTDVAVKLINSKTNGKKSLDKCHAARITRRARISPCALMMGILYTERLAHSNPCYLKKVSSSDLFVVSMLVASKYLYDDGEDDDAYNYDWSKAGNYHVSDLNRLEREFLNSIEWKIFVSSKEFFDFVNKIETRVALDQGSERGWYSYLDMRTLLENSLFKDLLKKYVTHTGKVILCCALAYTFSVALLFSTPVILNSYLDQQSIVDIERDLALLPAISFLGHIGHLEYALAISVSVRSRQAKDALKLIDVVQNVSVKSNDTQNRIHSGKSCGKCGHSETDLFYKVKKPLQANRYVAVDRTKCSEERSCINNMVAFNGTAMRNSDNLSFNQVLAFMKFPFNHSWTYREVRFPVWENSYSDILIGFSTSAVTAAVVAA